MPTFVRLCGPVIRFCVRLGPGEASELLPADSEPGTFDWPDVLTETACGGRELAGERTGLRYLGRNFWRTPTDGGSTGSGVAVLRSDRSRLQSPLRLASSELRRTRRDLPRVRTIHRTTETDRTRAGSTNPTIRTDRENADPMFAGVFGGPVRNRCGSAGMCRGSARASHGSFRTLGGDPPVASVILERAGGTCDRSGTTQQVVRGLPRVASDLARYAFESVRSTPDAIGSFGRVGRSAPSLCAPSRSPFEPGNW